VPDNVEVALAWLRCKHQSLEPEPVRDEGRAPLELQTVLEGFDEGECLHHQVNDHVHEGDLDEEHHDDVVNPDQVWRLRIQLKLVGRVPIVVLRKHSIYQVIAESSVK
jgi:hypothetical protein